jgi:type II secretory pathway predicted ATPase ExeA/outer membrane protein OmpA-like peptidoglycan-associated protein
VHSLTPETSVQNQLFGHFGVRENPFGGTPDPRFLFHSETHREALASLINGIDCEFGFQVLVAQPGMGKTTLLFNFLEGFRATAHTAFLFQPQVEPHELLQSLLFELGAGCEDTSVRKLSEHINQFLGQAARERKRVIVVVDEAQNLDFKVLETLRQLSNFETARAKLMQIILAGQPQLVNKLAAPEQEQLRQRISSIGRLSPLNLNETRAYLNHRLRTAGYRGGELFTQGAVRKIWEDSKGVPRNINTISFNAMLLGFAGSKKSIDEIILAEASRDLDMPSVFADMYRLDPSLVLSPRNVNGLAKFQQIRETKSSDTEDLISKNLAPAAGGVSQKVDLPAAAVLSGSGNGAGAGENIPMALVEAIVRISQTLEEQKVLLAAKTAQPLEPIPAAAPSVPVASKVAAAAESAAALGTIAATSSDKPQTSAGAMKPVPATSNTRTITPSASDRAVSTEKGLQRKPEKSAQSIQSATKSVAPASPVEKKASAPLNADSPVKSTPPVATAKSSGSFGFWAKAVALATITSALTFVVVEQSPWENRARANANEFAASATDQNESASGYSVPKGSPTSPMDAQIRPSKTSGVNGRGSRDSDSNSFDDVTVRKFPEETNAPGSSAGAQEPSTIFFDQDSAAISESYRIALRQIADALAKDPEASAILEGHTDDTGPESYNLDLSSRRATAVREALINEFNVPSTQLTAIGSGSAAPVQPNSNAEGRAYNRRVSVRFVRLGQQ